MRLDYINPFVDATYAILEDVFEAPSHKGKLSLRGGPVISKGVVITIGLTGGCGRQGVV